MCSRVLVLCLAVCGVVYGADFDPDAWTIKLVAPQGQVAEHITKDTEVIYYYTITNDTHRDINNLYHRPIQDFPDHFRIVESLTEEQIRAGTGLELPVCHLEELNDEAQFAVPREPPVLPDNQSCVFGLSVDAFNLRSYTTINFGDMNMTLVARVGEIPLLNYFPSLSVMVRDPGKITFKSQTPLREGFRWFLTRDEQPHELRVYNNVIGSILTGVYIDPRSWERLPDDFKAYFGEQPPVAQDCEFLEYGEDESSCHFVFQRTAVSDNDPLPQRMVHGVFALRSTNNTLRVLYIRVGPLADGIMHLSSDQPAITSESTWKLPNDGQAHILKVSNGEPYSVSIKNVRIDARAWQHLPKVFRFYFGEQPPVAPSSCEQVGSALESNCEFRFKRTDPATKSDALWWRTWQQLKWYTWPVTLVADNAPPVTVRIGLS